jgi:DNA-binding NarL/FixJ family response regulator
MKHASAGTLLEAIRRVLAGRVYLSPAMTDKLLEKASGSEPAAGGSPVDGLSDRELEVFKLIGRGLRPQRIAEDLQLSIKTVETYYSRLKLKLNVRDAAALLQLAIAWHGDLKEPGETP